MFLRLSKFSGAFSFFFIDHADRNRRPGSLTLNSERDSLAEMTIAPKTVFLVLLFLIEHHPSDSLACFHRQAEPNFEFKLALQTMFCFALEQSMQSAKYQLKYSACLKCPEVSFGVATKIDECGQ